MVERNIKAMSYLICTLFMLVGSATANSTYPSSIEQAKNTTLMIYYGKGKGCNAVRVGEKLILSAAHCLTGYDGMKKIKKAQPIYLYADGIKHELNVLEMGQFKPRKDKMSDWVLFEPVEGEVVLSSIRVAEFPDKQEMQKILNNLGGFDGRKKGETIWAITHPNRTFRMYPRAGSDGKSLLISKGYLKSEQAYKKHILFTITNFQYYDELQNAKSPEFEVNVENEWKKLEQNGYAKNIYNLYNKYKHDNNPILYHNADYSYGSSGGGFFAEQTGHYLGLLPMGTSIGSIQMSFVGIGQLYRVDEICRQSKVLSGLEKCQKLIN